MTKVFFAKVRKVNLENLGITIPKEIQDTNKLIEGENYWFKLMGKVKQPGEEQ